MNTHADAHWAQCDFLVIDVEGNGQSPQELIELAIIHVHRGQIVDPPRQWLIRPRKPVSDRASRLHGIMDSHLTSMPFFREIAAEVHEVLGQHAVVGHNVAVDVQLLKKELSTWRPLVAIDTLKLARRADPTANSYALQSLVQGYGIAPKLHGMPHRAATDALATAELFLHLARLLDGRGELNLRALADISAALNDPFFTTTQGNLF